MKKFDKKGTNEPEKKAVVKPEIVNKTENADLNAISGKQANIINTKRITAMGMFCAIAFVFKLVSDLVPPIMPAAPFLSYDAKDIILAISGFILGPLPAFIITVITSLIEMITVSSTGFYGLAMNIFSSSMFCIIPAIFYKKFKNLGGAVVGLALGIVSTTAAMLLWNYVITPIYMGYPREAVAKMLVPVFLPFNLIKTGINASLSMLLYKPGVSAMRQVNLIEKKENDKTKINIVLIITCVAILAVCALAIILINNVK